MKLQRLCELAGINTTSLILNEDKSYDEILNIIDQSLLDDIYQIVNEEKPSEGLSKKEKSELVKKAKKGEDVGKKGKKFKEVEKKAAKFYGSKEAGRRVAAAAMWKHAA